MLFAVRLFLMNLKSAIAPSGAASSSSEAPRPPHSFRHHHHLWTHVWDDHLAGGWDFLAPVKKASSSGVHHVVLHHFSIADSPFPSPMP